MHVSPARSSIIVFMSLSLLLLAFALVIILPTIGSADPLPSTVFTWESRSDALIDRVEGVGAVVDDKLYVFSGFIDEDLHIAAQVDRYDMATDSWATIGEMPVPTTHLNPVVDGQTIWFAGGFVGDHPGPATNNVWKYSVPTNTWAAGPALPDARAAGTLIRCGRYLHYFGGFLTDRNTTTTDHWRLHIDDPAATWEAVAALPEPLGHLSSALIDGKIYAIGGQLYHDRDPVDKTSVYRYDTASNSWSALASLPTPRSHAEPGTFVYRGRIIVVGGRNNAIIRPSELSTITMYDPPTNTWIALPKLPFTRLAPIAQPFGNEIIVTNGGEWWNKPERTTLAGVLDNTWELGHPTLPISLGEATSGIIDHRLFVVSNATSSTLAFDLSSDKWITETLAAPLLASRGQAAEVAAGKFYLFGGTDAAATRLQIYDPAANSWSFGSDMPFAAAYSAVTRIGDWIYISGGEVGGAHTNAFGRYNIVSGIWEILPPLPVAVVNAAAGSDGQRFYLFGGSTEQNVLDIVQVYDPASSTWQTSNTAGGAIAALPRPRSNAGRALFLGGEFYLTSGKGSDGSPVASVDIYNPTNATWRQGADQPVPRYNTWPSAIADRIYIAGGSIATGEASAMLEVYNAVPLTAMTDPSECETATPSATPILDSTPTLFPSPEASPTAPTTPTPAQIRCLYLPIFFT
jgi:N-acetylneuraminic acid mutarotase